MTVEISTQKVAKSGTHLYGNMMQSLLDSGGKLYRELKALISYWQENSNREHPARDMSPAIQPSHLDLGLE